MKEKNESLDFLIQALEKEMEVSDPTTEDYAKLLDRYEKLTRLRREGVKSRVDPNTVIVAAGNLVGILAMLNFEKLGVITSKALGFIMKPKVK